MKIRSSFAFVFTLFSIASGQVIENSFPAPSDNITGLALNDPIEVLALDPVEGVIYKIDNWTGAVLETISLPSTPNPAVGLARGDSGIWYAEQGTALIHKIDGDGTLLATYDYSDSGVVSISGLDIGSDNHYPHPTWALYFIDSATQIIYMEEFPIGSGMLQQYLDIEGCPEVYDIGPPRAYDCIPVACNDPVSPVRCYYDSDSYYTLYSGEFESARGVGPAYEYNRFYFNDPEMGMIHRYCLDMGGIAGGDGILTSASILSNPSPGVAAVGLTLTEEALVDISVYDVTGRMVLRMPGINCPAGTSEQSITGLDRGVFLVRITALEQSMTLRLVVLD